MHDEQSAVLMSCPVFVFWSALCAVQEMGRLKLRILLLYRTGPTEKKGKETMLFANIDVLDEALEYHNGCYVGIRGNKIAYIGIWKPKEDFGKVYDGTGKLLMSGFFNAHGHSAMTLMRGYAENLTLTNWLHQKIFPFEAKLDEEAIYNGTMLAAAEMLRFGVVSVSDMYLSAPAACRAAMESGIKMNFGLAGVCEQANEKERCEAYRERVKENLAYHNTGDGRVKIDLAIHAEYTSTRLMVEEIAALAKTNGLNIQLHLSETKAEHEACKKRQGGKTPAKYFYDAGVFNNPTTAAHCVWVEEGDLELLRQENVTVACCPVSNLKLSSGSCPVSRISKKGIHIALGTDGAASNNNLNIMEEMKLFSMMPNTEDAAGILPRQALYAATRAGALAQGRTDSGALRVGNRADLIVLDLRKAPHMHPMHDAVNNVVFAAQGSDVCLTMVDGKVLYCDGEYPTLDLDRVIRRAEESVEKILKQL